jgi:hypothetical protein
MENHSVMMWTGETLDSSIRVPRQSYQQSHLAAKREELAKKMNNLAYEIFL